jgi:hypothetical protein
MVALRQGIQEAEADKVFLGNEEGNSWSCELPDSNLPNSIYQVE